MSSYTYSVVIPKYWYIVYTLFCSKRNEKTNIKKLIVDTKANTRYQKYHSSV